ncbi:Gfo/Idh/MocA family oxidoreductase [Opitutus sp. ER46]|uniref:Gfo/Idh/MocA family protein n=1 Tax=Opitutus sp. ER46 TaxID=2161864 RepID=UPI000D31E498|nr:Gfo/Idh/MocA family oxidoreductase [Opitutus sp. ER46]PTX91061.1 dehydrogenase [Opitutus sp. ER46]
MPPLAAPAPLRVGLIGLDTSHVVEFTRLLNDAAHPEHVPGAHVVAAVHSGSPDMPEKSWARIPGFAHTLATAFGVQLCGAIADLLPLVDAVMIENVDGRKHLEVARAVLPAGKPVFIDKPLAASLADGAEIIRLARDNQVPCFSASTLRYAPEVTALATPDVRTVLGITPCDYEPHHPDLFWYGVHGVETLYAVLGAGCESVSRTHTADTDVVTGRWSDGRIGLFCGHRGTSAGHGCQVLRPSGWSGGPVVPRYAPLVREIVRFFQSGVSPVGADEMLEVLAFMSAAEESQRRGGAAVAIAPLT